MPGDALRVVRWREFSRQGIFSVSAGYRQLMPSGWMGKIRAERFVLAWGPGHRWGLVYGDGKVCSDDVGTLVFAIC
jgi:hypothetical protein